MVKKTSSARSVSTIRTPERAQIYSSRARTIDPISRDVLPSPPIRKQETKIRGVESSPLDDLLRSRPSGDLGYEEKYSEIKSWIDSNKSVFQDPRYADEARRIIQSEQRKLDSKSQRDVQQSLDELKRIKEQSLPYDQSVAAIESWLERNRSAVERSSQGVGETQRLIGEIDAEAEERNYARAKEITSSFNSANLSYEEHSAQLNELITTHGDLLGLGERNYSLSNAFVQSELNKLEQKNIQELQRAKAELQLQGSYENKVESLNSWIEKNKDILGRGDSNYEQSQKFIDKKVKEIENSNIRDLESAFKSLKLQGSYSDQVEQLNKFIEDNESLLGRGDKNYAATQVFLKQKERELQAANSADFREATRQLDLTGKTYTEQVSALQKWVEDYGDVLGRGENYSKTQEFLKQKESRFNQLNREEFQSAVSNLQLSGSYEEQAAQLNRWVEDYGDVLGRGDNYSLATDLISTKEKTIDAVAKRDFQSAKENLMSQWESTDLKNRGTLLDSWIESNQDILQRAVVFDDAKDLISLKEQKLYAGARDKFSELKDNFQLTGSNYLEKTDSLNKFIEDFGYVLGSPDVIDDARDFIAMKKEKLDKEKVKDFEKAKTTAPTSALGFAFQGELDRWLDQNPIVRLEENIGWTQSFIDSQLPDLKKRTTTTAAGYSLFDIKNDNRFIKEYHSDGSLRKASLRPETYYLEIEVDNRGREFNSRSRTYTPYVVEFDRQGNVVFELKREPVVDYIDDTQSNRTIKSVSLYNTIDVKYDSKGKVVTNKSEPPRPVQYQSQLDGAWRQKRIESNLDKLFSSGQPINSRTLFDALDVDNSGEINILDILGTGAQTKGEIMRAIVEQTMDYNRILEDQQRKYDRDQNVLRLSQGNLDQGVVIGSDKLFEVWGGGSKEINILEPGFREAVELTVSANQRIRAIQEKYADTYVRLDESPSSVLKRAEKLEGDFALSSIALKNLRGAEVLTPQQIQDINSRFQLQEGMKEFNKLEKEVVILSAKLGFDQLDKASDAYRLNPTESNLAKLREAESRVQSIPQSEINKLQEKTTMTNILARDLSQTSFQFNQTQEQRANIVSQLQAAEKKSADVKRIIINERLSAKDARDLSSSALIETRDLRADYLGNVDIYNEFGAGRNLGLIGSVKEGLKSPSMSFKDSASLLGSGLMTSLSNFGERSSNLFKGGGFALSSQEKKQSDFLMGKDLVKPSTAANIAPFGYFSTQADMWKGGEKIRAIASTPFTLLGEGIKGIGSGFSLIGDLSKRATDYSEARLLSIGGAGDSENKLSKFYAGSIRTISAPTKIKSGLFSGLGDYVQMNPTATTLSVTAGFAMGGVGAMGGVKATASAAKGLVATGTPSKGLTVGSALKAVTGGGIKGLTYMAYGATALNVGVKMSKADSLYEVGSAIGGGVAPLLSIKAGGAAFKGFVAAGGAIKVGGVKLVNLYGMEQLKAVKSLPVGQRKAAMDFFTKSFYDSSGKPLPAAKAMEIRKTGIAPEGTQLLPAKVKSVEFVRQTQDMSLKDISKLGLYDSGDVAIKLAKTTAIGGVEFDRVYVQTGKDLTSSLKINDAKYSAQQFKLADASVGQKIYLGGEPKILKSASVKTIPGKQTATKLVFEDAITKRIESINIKGDDFIARRLGPLQISGSDGIISKGQFISGGDKFLSTPILGDSKIIAKITTPGQLGDRMKAISAGTSPRIDIPGAPQFTSAKGSIFVEKTAKQVGLIDSMGKKKLIPWEDVKKLSAKEFQAFGLRETPVVVQGKITTVKTSVGRGLVSETPATKVGDSFSLDRKMTILETRKTTFPYQETFTVPLGKVSPVSKRFSLDFQGDLVSKDAVLMSLQKAPSQLIVAKKAVYGTSFLSEGKSLVKLSGAVKSKAPLYVLDKKAIGDSILGKISGPGSQFPLSGTMTGSKLSSVFTRTSGLNVGVGGKIMKTPIFGEKGISGIDLKIDYTTPLSTKADLIRASSADYKVKLMSGEYRDMVSLNIPASQASNFLPVTGKAGKFTVLSDAKFQYPFEMSSSTPSVKIVRSVKPQQSSDVKVEIKETIRLDYYDRVFKLGPIQRLGGFEKAGLILKGLALGPAMAVTSVGGVGGVSFKAALVAKKRQVELYRGVGDTFLKDVSYNKITSPEFQIGPLKDSAKSFLVKGTKLPELRADSSFAFPQLVTSSKQFDYIQPVVFKTKFPEFKTRVPSQEMAFRYSSPDSVPSEIVRSKVPSVVQRKGVEIRSVTDILGITSREITETEKTYNLTRSKTGFSDLNLISSSDLNLKTRSGLEKISEMEKILGGSFESLNKVKTEEMTKLKSDVLLKTDLQLLQKSKLQLNTLTQQQTTPISAPKVGPLKMNFPSFKPPNPPKFDVPKLPEPPDLEFDSTPRKKKVKPGTSKKFVREFKTLDLLGTSKRSKNKSSLMYL